MENDPAPHLPSDAEAVVRMMRSSTLFQVKLLTDTERQRGSSLTAQWCVTEEQPSLTQTVVLALDSVAAKSKDALFKLIMCS